MIMELIEWRNQEESLLQGEHPDGMSDLQVVFWFWCFLLCLCDPICHVPDDETTVFHAESFNSLACLSHC